MIAAFQRDGVYPRVLLHACCAPCSSACLEFLRQYFDVTVFFYNPNITDGEEYRRRVEEEERLIRAYNEQVATGDFTGMRFDTNARPVEVLYGSYDPAAFLEIAKGVEDAPEGGERCRRCFTLRLSETAKAAVQGGFDFFTTTLTISPMKNAALLNTIGREAGDREGVPFLPSDFKKRDGYLRSTQLSKRLGLYRQDYCGCEFSKRDRITD